MASPSLLLRAAPVIFLCLIFCLQVVVHQSGQVRCFLNSMQELPQTTTTTTITETSNGGDNNITLSALSVSVGVLLANQTHPLQQEEEPEYVSYHQLFGSNNTTNQSTLSTLPSNPVPTLPPVSTWLLLDNHESSPHEADTDDNDTRNSTTSPQIPRVITKIYIQKDGGFPHDDMANQSSYSLRQAHRSWIRHNPGYRLQYVDLHRARRYLQKYFHPTFLRAFDCIQAFSGKANLFRVALLYQQGGWYSDWKQVCLKPGLLDQLSSKNRTFVSTWDKNTNYMQQQGSIQMAFLGSTPRHPVLQEILKLILEHVQTEFYGTVPTSMTGPLVAGWGYRKAQELHVDDKNSLQGVHVFGQYIWTKQAIVDSKGKQIIKHKCKGCGYDQKWGNTGNDYKQMFHEHRYYCEDAASIYQT